MGYASYLEDILERAAQIDRFALEIAAHLEKRTLEPADLDDARRKHEAISTQVELIERHIYLVMDFLTDPLNHSIAHMFDEFLARRAAEESLTLQETQSQKDKQLIRELRDIIKEQYESIKKLKAERTEARRTAAKYDEMLNKIFSEHQEIACDFYNKPGRKANE